MGLIERSGEIRDRRDFAALCNNCELVEAVEVGVDRGEFAECFMRSWRGNTLSLVDLWEPYEEMGFPREADMLLTVHRLTPYADRVRFIRAKSQDAVKLILSARLDFVYIDASHVYENVIADIAAWWERLTPGGILAGHDFDQEHPGVRRAVQEFAEKHERRILLTCEGETAASWYTYKPIPPQ